MAREGSSRFIQEISIEANKNIKNLGSIVLHATNNDVECGITYRCEE
jgi:hypothetical protein